MAWREKSESCRRLPSQSSLMKSSNELIGKCHAIDLGKISFCFCSMDSKCLWKFFLSDSAVATVSFLFLVNSWLIQIRLNQHHTGMTHWEFTQSTRNFIGSDNNFSLFFMHWNRKISDAEKIRVGKIDDSDERVSRVRRRKWICESNKSIFPPSIAFEICSFLPFPSLSSYTTFPSSLIFIRPKNVWYLRHSNNLIMSKTTKHDSRWRGNERKKIFEYFHSPHRRRRRFW